MLDAYPNGKASIGNSYIGIMAALLCRYPRLIALRCADPIGGVATKTKFIPTVADVVAWCEPLTSDMHCNMAREDRMTHQLRERDEIEQRRLSAGPRQSLQEVREEMRARGFPMGGAAGGHRETVASVKTKLGISDEQWDALPDAPPAGHWDRLMAKHVGIPKPATTR